MTEKIYTIGFTRRTAEDFFETLEENNIDEVVDVRLHNNSQLASFTKYPDLEYFLRKILNADYRHDLQLAPSKQLFDGYKNKIFDWFDYECEFAKLMYERKISEHIAKNYSAERKYCFLCAESSPENCHRRLVAEKFAEVFDSKIIHL